MSNLPTAMNESASLVRSWLAVGRRDQATPSSDEAADTLGFSRQRVTARLAAHRMLQAAQDEPQPDDAAIHELIELGDRNLWHEVSVVARCAAGISGELGGDFPDELINDMARRADTSHDPALVALSLAIRSCTTLLKNRGEGPPNAGAETDLATAIVALERGMGGSLERLVAHTVCGISLGIMGLWELELDQYEAAAAIDPLAEEAALAGHEADIAAFCRPILYNRIEVETNYACALLLVGDGDQALAHCASVLEGFAAVRAAGAWPASWVSEIEAFVLMARAIAGDDVAADAARIEATGQTGPDRESSTRRRRVAANALRVGQAHLAVALSLASRDVDAAKQSVEAAIVALEASETQQPLTLALALAAELEGATAGRRLARAQTDKLWNGRQKNVTAMLALLQTERLRARSEEMERHAHVDELTGLANRRGFYRHIDDLAADGCSLISLLIIDIDRSKHGSDRNSGPGADAALRRLAAVLARSIRPRDVAAHFGGDEFFLLLEGTTAAVAEERARAIDDAITGGRTEDDVAFSVSIGVASGRPDEFDLLLADADRAIHSTKAASGRRRSASLGER